MRLLEACTWQRPESTLPIKTDLSALYLPKLTFGVMQGLLGGRRSLTSMNVITTPSILSSTVRYGLKRRSYHFQIGLLTSRRIGAKSARTARASVSKSLYCS